MAAANESAVEPFRKQQHSDGEGAEIEQPRPAVAAAATRDLPGRDLRFSGPIRFVFIRDVMEIVQLRRFHPSRGVWEINRERFGFDADPSGVVAAAFTQTGPREKE